MIVNMDFRLYMKMGLLAHTRCNIRSRVSNLVHCIYRQQV
jgi:hypothetical protein